MCNDIESLQQKQCDRIVFSASCWILGLWSLLLSLMLSEVFMESFSLGWERVLVSMGTCTSLLIQEPMLIYLLTHSIWLLVKLYLYIQKDVLGEDGESLYIGTFYLYVTLLVQLEGASFYYRLCGLCSNYDHSSGRWKEKLHASKLKEENILSDIWSPNQDEWESAGNIVSGSCVTISKLDKLMWAGWDLSGCDWCKQNDWFLWFGLTMARLGINFYISRLWEVLLACL